MPSSNDKTSIFVFLVLFWSFLIMVTSYFDLGIEGTNMNDLIDNNKELPKMSWYQKFKNAVFSELDQLPLISSFVPIARIMTFSVTNEVPVYISIVLNIIAIFSAYMILSIVRGTN